MLSYENALLATVTRKCPDHALVPATGEIVAVLRANAEALCIDNSEARWTPTPRAEPQPDRVVMDGMVTVDRALILAIVRKLVERNLDAASRSPD